jgi:hypothetical protein
MTAPTVWSSAVPPGGYVCAVPDATKPDGVCGEPVESEPCREHTRCTTCGHDEPNHDAGECWARMNGEQCDCGWYEPAWKAATR